MKKFTKVFLTVLILLLVLGGAYLVAENMRSESSGQHPGTETDAAALKPEEKAAEEAPLTAAEPEKEQEPEFKDEKDIINILLVGVDNNYLPTMDGRGNADGIVILTINKNTEKIAVSSILRCVSLSIDENTRNMATLIFHDHGIEFLADCIERNFDIEIDNYVMMNYLNVLEIIEAAGGIDVEIKKTELEEFNWKMEEVNLLVGDPKGTDTLGFEDIGMRHLNGKQATVYMRLRLGGGDEFGRTARIRTVLSKLKDKVLEMNLLEMNKLAGVVKENISTDMSTKDVISLAASAAKFLKYELQTCRIPLDGSYDTDGSFLFINMEKNTQALHDAIYK